MHILGLGFFVVASFFAANAQAANVLTNDQLVLAIQESVADYAAAEPEMSQSITGMKVTTAGKNAQVTLEMKTDGMNMSAKYLCVAQGKSMACRQQQ